MDVGRMKDPILDRPLTVRFAPSPTGYLHIGNARTAVFNYLLARRTGGRLILRLEDTDRERSESRYADAILEDLAWLGLSWDEGPDVGGPSAPYEQSRRLEHYREALDRLIRSGRAYPCFCSRQELRAMRERQAAKGLPPRYDNRCRAVPPDEAARRVEAGEEHVYRFRLPDGKVEFDDLVRGRVSFDLSRLGDPVIFRSDGLPSFHLAVVVDDALMGVDLVLRGDGHLANTPIHIELARALGWSPPLYAHMSLTHGPDGRPLSKRKGAVALRDYRKEGRPPEALAAYIMHLGWGCKGRDYLSLDEAAALFDVRELTSAPARHDPPKLDHLCKRFLLRAPRERLLELWRDYLAVNGLSDRPLPLEEGKLEQAVEWFARGAVTMAEVFDGMMRLAVPDEWRAPHSETELLQVWRERLAAAEGVFEREDKESFEKTARAVGEETGLKGRALYQPLRYALTGSPRSIELHRILYLLGRGETLRRLEAAAGGKA